MTSHFLVKVGFLNSKLLRTFGGSNEVSFGCSLAHFKALELRYNFPKNSLLQKMHQFFIIPKIPLEGQNCQKLTFFQNDLFAYLTPFSMLEFFKLVQIHAFKLHSLHYLPNHLQNTKPSKMSRNVKN